MLPKVKYHYEKSKESFDFKLSNGKELPLNVGFDLFVSNDVVNFEGDSFFRGKIVEKRFGNEFFVDFFFKVDTFEAKFNSLKRYIDNNPDKLISVFDLEVV